jgi:hypothetical protein
MRVAVSVGLAMLAGITGCESRDVRAEPPASAVVDSVLPREEALRRFRTGLRQVDSLTGGSESRDALVSALMRALAAEDTAAIAGLAVSRSEFAYLYYPTASEGLPPYDLEPGLMWFMLFERSNQGVRNLLQRYGGTRMEVLDHHCGTGHRQEGENRVYGPCVVRWRSTAGDTVAARLFSRILDRDGRFKFLSYANRLD